MDFTTAAKWYFDVAWTFLTSFNFPGTNVTPFAFLVFAAFFGVVVRFVQSLLRGTLTPPPSDPPRRPIGFDR